MRNAVNSVNFYIFIMVFEALVKVYVEKRQSRSEACTVHYFQGKGDNFVTLLHIKV